MSTPKIALFNKEGEEQKIVQSGIGNRPAIYPFRQMNVGDYFVLDAPEDCKERRDVSMRLYTAASQFSNRNPPVGFSTHYNGKTLTVTRIK